MAEEAVEAVGKQTFLIIFFIKGNNQQNETNLQKVERKNNKGTHMKAQNTNFHFREDKHVADDFPLAQTRRLGLERDKKRGLKR